MADQFEHVSFDMPGSQSYQGCDECKSADGVIIFFGSPEDHSGLRLCFRCLEKVYKQATFKEVGL